MLVDKLIKMRTKPVIGKIALKMLAILGLSIPISVKIGKNVTFPHNSVGTVIHDNTVIEDNVKIYQNVTLGRSDIYQDARYSKMQGFLIKEGAILCAGAKVLCKNGTLVIGKNTIVAANAVLINSTGDNEIWGGIPAKQIGIRKDNVK